MTRILPISLLLLYPLAAAEPKDPQAAGFFEQKIRPVLVEHCYSCHSAAAAKADKLRGGLLLDSRAGWQKGGDNGPAIQPGKPAESLLIQAMKYEGDTHMPPKGKLPAEVIADFVKWVESGAYDPRDGTAELARKEIDIVSGRKYWAFQPLAPAKVPTASDPAWNRTEIDRFLFAGMSEKGLKPAPPADAATLIRRLYFDLIGLPPTPQELQAFLQDPSASAYEKRIDQLLASPAYGERWARHWLDPARYAESTGFEHDYIRPNAYHYRDFVIKAFNSNMPYDRFVQWQIAGDELAPDDPLALAATGFLGAGVYPTQITTREAERIRYDAMDDMLSSTGSAILGLTIGCARCHDHKYDPIPTRDYYRMLAAFTTAVRSEIEVILGTPEEKSAAQRFDAERQKLAENLTRYENTNLGKNLLAWIQGLKQANKDKPDIQDANASKGFAAIWDGSATLNRLPRAQREAVIRWYAPQDDEHRKLKKTLEDFEATAPKVQRLRIMAVTEGQKPMRHHTADASIPDFYPDTYILKRGDVTQKDGKAEPGILQVLHRDGFTWTVQPPAGAATSHKRAALARWLTDIRTGAGALTARVFVNRLWHHHFGRGIVSTVNDFGIQGDPPTHPELLEWLAHDFATHGWDIKRLHKSILMTQAFRLSGIRSEANRKIDPDNRWLWHRPKRRLEAEAIRDSLLAVSGLLDRTMYGPGTLEETMKRRSIYFQIRRSQMIPMLQVFDWPDTLTSCGVRSTTVVAPQALFFLNHPVVAESARRVAEPMLKEPDNGQVVEQLYLQLFARKPHPAEIAAGQEFLGSARDRGKAMADYVRSLLSLNEFIYVN